RVAAGLCPGARLGAGPLPGPAARRADPPAAPALRSAWKRPRQAGGPGAQRRRQRRRGGLLPGGRDPAHGDLVTDYAAFAAHLTAGGVISDPWYEGQPRFQPSPVVLKEAEQAALYRAAEQ